MKVLRTLPLGPHNLRYLLASIIGCFFIATGLVRKHVKQAKSGNIITSIYFHNPSAQLFEKCIKWLITNKYYFISLDELYDLLISRKAVPGGGACIMVDDGWRDNIKNIIPVIDKYKVPVCFFISTEPVENGVFWWTYVRKGKEMALIKPLSVDDLKSMPESERKKRIGYLKEKFFLAREAMTKEDVAAISSNPLITIGSHTVNHAYTDRCSETELVREIRDSKEILFQWTKKEIKFFSYPNGNFKGDEHCVLSRNNYLMAFTTRPDFINTNNFEIFYLPRFCVNDNGPLVENICKITGVWQNKLNLMQRPRALQNWRIR